MDRGVWWTTVLGHKESDMTNTFTLHVSLAPLSFDSGCGGGCLNMGSRRKREVDDLRRHILLYFLFLSDLLTYINVFQCTFT